MMALEIDKRKCALKTKSPLHIGWHGDTYGLGLVKQKQDVNSIFIVDQDKLLKLLREQELLDEFVNTFSSPDVFKTKEKGKDKKGSLQVFLENHPSLLSEISNIASAKAISGAKGAFIKDGNGKEIIPGSTIKGALRTAVAYRQIKLEKNDLGEAAFLHKYEAIIEDKLKQYKGSNNRENYAKFVDEDIVDILFGTDPDNDHPNPHYDLFRAVTVTDGYPDKSSVKETMKVLCIDDSGNPYLKPFIDSKRCLEMDTRVEFEIRLDKNIIKWWDERREKEKKRKSPFHSIDELLDIAQKLFTQDQWEYERGLLNIIKDQKSRCINSTTPQLARDYFNSLYGYYDKKPNIALRLGWGTGLLGTTIDLLLESDSDNKSLNNPVRQKIRKMIGKGSGNLVPKSRRVVIKPSGECLPLGWVSIS